MARHTSPKVKGRSSSRPGPDVARGKRTAVGFWMHESDYQLLKREATSRSMYIGQLARKIVLDQLRGS